MCAAPQLSIVIPAYNEAKRISRTLETLQKYLDGRSWRSEVIVVNDGSSDETWLSLNRTANGTPCG
jgi:glycosyltransferase involved in cell wall biosynthesis